MPNSNDEIERRRNAALTSIKQAFGTSADQHGVTLFVSHHLEELESDYWQKHCEVARPEPNQVLELLTLQSHWSEDADNGIDTFDFSLPEDATDYVISVCFDDKGDVSEITMES